MKNIKFYSLWLAFIMIAIFALQNLPGIPGLTETFILNNKALTNYQYYRFLTAIFLHGSITHLLFNLFALLFFGLTLEKLIGSNKFLFTFLFTGIIANIISVNFYNSSLGASGAIYGIIGAVAIIRPMMMVWTFGLIMPMFLASILYITADILRTLGRLQMIWESNLAAAYYWVWKGWGLGILGLGIVWNWSDYADFFLKLDSPEARSFNIPLEVLLLIFLWLGITVIKFPS